jgi:hypothetical protein
LVSVACEHSAELPSTTPRLRFAVLDACAHVICPPWSAVKPASVSVETAAVASTTPPTTAR